MRVTLLNPLVMLAATAVPLATICARRFDHVHLARFRSELNFFAEAPASEMKNNFNKKQNCFLIMTMENRTSFENGSQSQSPFMSGPAETTKGIVAETFFSLIKFTASIPHRSRCPYLRSNRYRLRFASLGC